MPETHASSPAALGAIEAIADCDTVQELNEVQRALAARFTELNMANIPATPSHGPPNVGPHHAAGAGFRIGDRVEFTITRGRQAGTLIQGTVRRINVKTITVYPDAPVPVHGSRGYVYRAARYYRVPPRMLRKI